ncbi:MAG: recombinase family protein [Thermodesulfobacteriota bacterium]
MREKAEQGLYPSCAPLGYINNRATRLIDIDKERAPYIKRIFELMAAGKHSIRMLERQIYIEGLRNRNSNRVGKSAIHEILKNPIYYGAFR